MPKAHRIWTLSFGPGVGSDLRADREHSLGFDAAGPEARPYHSIDSRKAKERWYHSKSYAFHVCQVGRGLRTRRAHAAARRGRRALPGSILFWHSIYNEERVTCSDVSSAPGTPRSLK